MTSGTGYSYILNTIFSGAAVFFSDKETRKKQLFSMMQKVEVRLFDPYKSGILFMGHRQTAQTQARHCIKRRLIRISTFCLQNVLLKT